MSQLLWIYIFNRLTTNRSWALIRLRTHRVGKDAHHGIVGSNEFFNYVRIKYHIYYL